MEVNFVTEGPRDTCLLPYWRHAAVRGAVRDTARRSDRAVNLAHQETGPLLTWQETRPQPRPSVGSSFEPYRVVRGRDPPSPESERTGQKSLLLRPPLSESLPPPLPESSSPSPASEGVDVC